MVQKYYSHGKFLLTGEYLVLKDALALALPLKLGQSLTVETVCTPSLQWNAYKPNGPWFSVTLNPENLEIINCDAHPKA
jgi:mevalonate kinase